MHLQARCGGTHLNYITSQERGGAFVLVVVVVVVVVYLLFCSIPYLCCSNVEVVFSPLSNSSEANLQNKSCEVIDLTYKDVKCSA